MVSVNNVWKVPLKDMLSPCAEGEVADYPNAPHSEEDFLEADRTGRGLPQESKAKREGTSLKMLTGAALAAVRALTDLRADHYGESEGEQQQLRLRKLTDTYGNTFLKVGRSFLERKDAQSKIDEAMSQMAELEPGSVTVDDVAKIIDHAESRAQLELALSRKNVDMPRDLWIPLTMLGHDEQKTRLFMEGVGRLLEPGTICSVPGSDGKPTIVGTVGMIDAALPYYLKTEAIGFSRRELDSMLSTYRGDHNGQQERMLIPVDRSGRGHLDANNASSAAMPASTKTLAVEKRLVLPGGAYLEDYALFLEVFTGVVTGVAGDKIIHTRERSLEEHTTWDVRETSITAARDPKQRRDIWVDMSQLTTEQIDKALQRMSNRLLPHKARPRAQALVSALHELREHAGKVKFPGIGDFIDHELRTHKRVLMGSVDISSVLFEQVRQEAKSKKLHATEYFTSESDTREQQRTSGVPADMAILLIAAFRKSGLQGQLQVSSSFDGVSATTVALRFRQVSSDGVGRSLGTKAPSILSEVAGFIQSKIHQKDAQGQQTTHWFVTAQLEHASNESVRRSEADAHSARVEAATEEASSKGFWTGIGLTILSTIGMGLIFAKDQTVAILRRVNPLRLPGYLRHQALSDMRTLHRERGERAFYVRELVERGEFNHGQLRNVPLAELRPLYHQHVVEPEQQSRKQAQAKITLLIERGIVTEVQANSLKVAQLIALHNEHILGPALNGLALTDYNIKRLGAMRLVYMEIRASEHAWRTVEKMTIHELSAELRTLDPSQVEPLLDKYSLTWADIEIDPNDPDRPGGGNSGEGARSSLRARLGAAWRALRDTEGPRSGASNARPSQQMRQSNMHGRLWSGMQREAPSSRGSANHARNSNMRRNLQRAGSLSPASESRPSSRPLTSASERARQRVQRPRPVVESMRKGGRR